MSVNRKLRGMGDQNLPVGLDIVVQAGLLNVFQDVSFMHIHCHLQCFSWSTCIVMYMAYAGYRCLSSTPVLEMQNILFSDILAKRQGFSINLKL